MYKIYFYKAKDGSQPVADYIRGLASKADKDSRIKLNKIQDYINALSEYGSYQFSTKNSGNDTVKSPIGMFESSYIDNDLKAVDAIIRQCS